METIFKEVIMGILDGFFDSVLEKIGKIFELAKEVIGEIVEKTAELAKEVAEDVGKAIETIGEYIGKTVEVITEYAPVVIEGVGKVLDIAGLGLETLINGIYEIGKMAIDFVKEHPDEVISIVSSFIGAVVSFASGNIPAGIYFLSSGILKSVKFYNEVLTEEQRANYDMPVEFTNLYERHNLKELSYNKIDEYVVINRCAPIMSDLNKLE